MKRRNGASQAAPPASSTPPECSSGGGRLTALDVIANAVARLVSAEDALEDGDPDYAHTLLVDLEADLVGSLAAFALEQAS